MAEDDARAVDEPFVADAVVEDSATEGLYIAVAATKLALKNRIVVDLLEADHDYSADRFMDDARRTLLGLADEARSDAERVEEIVRDLRAARLRRNRRHGYQRGDINNLKKRLKQSELIDHTLRARADDERALRGLIDAARDAAWHEIARNITHNLDSEFERVEVDDADRAERSRRMDEVRRVDLPRLAARVRRETRGASQVSDHSHGRPKPWWTRIRDRFSTKSQG